MTALYNRLSSPPKLANNNAIRHQAATLSMAPAASTKVPSLVLARPCSWMTLVSIGKAVIEINAPRNKVACTKLKLLANKRPYSSNQLDKSLAMIKGTKIPDAEIARALRVRLWNIELSNSSPTKKYICRYQFVRQVAKTTGI